MTLAELVPLALKASIIMTVFAIGLHAMPRDLVYLARHPRRLALSLISLFVVMLVVAIIAIRVLDLPRPVEIVLVALALAPVPPLLPKRQAKAGGGASYTVGLLTAAALVSIVWIPTVLSLWSGFHGVELRASATALSHIAFVMILMPLAAGALVRRFAPGFADWVETAFATTATLLLAVTALLILFKTWHGVLAAIGGGSVLAFAAFVIVGLVTGHMLGGPDEDDRTVLALATASRHPGIALSIAMLNFPQEQGVAATVVLYLAVSVLVAAPYVALRKRAVAKRAAAGGL